MAASTRDATLQAAPENAGQTELQATDGEELTALLRHFRIEPAARQDNGLFGQLVAALHLKPREALGLWTVLGRDGWRRANEPAVYLRIAASRWAIADRRAAKRHAGLRIADLRSAQSDDADSRPADDSSQAIETRMLDRAVLIEDGLLPPRRTPFPIDCSPNSIEPALAPAPIKRGHLPPLDGPCSESRPEVHDTWLLPDGGIDWRGVAATAGLDEMATGALLWRAVVGIGEDTFVSTYPVEEQSAARAAWRRFERRMPLLRNILSSPRWVLPKQAGSLTEGEKTCR